MNLKTVYGVVKQLRFKFDQAHFLSINGKMKRFPTEIRNLKKLIRKNLKRISTEVRTDRISP